MDPPCTHTHHANRPLPSNKTGRDLPCRMEDQWETHQTRGPLYRHSLRGGNELGLGEALCQVLHPSSTDIYFEMRNQQSKRRLDLPGYHQLNLVQTGPEWRSQGPKPISFSLLEPTSIWKLHQCSFRAYPRHWMSEMNPPRASRALTKNGVIYP